MVIDYAAFKENRELVIEETEKYEYIKEVEVADLFPEIINNPWGVE